MTRAEADRALEGDGLSWSSALADIEDSLAFYLRCEHPWLLPSEARERAEAVARRWAD